MKSRLSIHLSVSLLTSAGAFAQIQGPTLGYLPDSGSLRVMQGIPSAGAIGNLLATDREFSQVVLLPGQNAALAVVKETGEPVVLTVGTDLTTATTPVGGAAGPAPDRIDVSPDGTAALLLDGASNRLRVITGLPAAPLVARSIETASLGSSPIALAVSDDGQWVAGIWPVGVYALGPHEEFILLPVGADASALAFFHSRHDLAFAGPAALLTVTDIGGGAATQVVYAPPGDAPQPSESPIAITVTPENQHLLVMPPSGTMGSIDLTTGEATFTACDCEPAGLNALGGALFRVSELANGAIKIYDAAAGRVWFVPLAFSAQTGFLKGTSPEDGSARRVQESGALRRGTVKP